MSHDYSNLEQQHNRGPGAHLSSSSRPSLENVIQTKLLFSPFQETLSHSPGQVQQFQVCRTTFPAIQIPKNKSLHWNSRQDLSFFCLNTQLSHFVMDGFNFRSVHCAS